MNEPLNELSSNAVLDSVAIDRIRVDPQVRTDYPEEGLKRLGRSLQLEGQLEPILAYLDPDGFYHVIAGHRRYEAAKRVGLMALKALVFSSRPTEGEIVRAQVVENTIRESLNPMDLAFAYQKLMTLEGITATQLATKLHVATSTVTRAIELTTLPEVLQGKVRSRELKPAYARELARITDPTKQAEVRAIIEEKKLNAGQTAALVAGVIKPKKPGRPRTNVKSTWKVNGFQATYQPGKKLVMIATGGQPKSPEQILRALEQVIAKLKEELGRVQASATLAAHGVQEPEITHTHH